MGALYTFTCTGCGYSANVAGGADFGFVIKTQTGICRKCDCLVDFVSGLREESDQEIAIGVCNQCKTPVSKIWNQGDDCPRCLGQFADPVFYMDWD